MLSAADSSSPSADSDSEPELRVPPPPPAVPPPRIVVQDTDRLQQPPPDSGLPGLRPEPIGAERDSSGSGSGSRERPLSQERADGATGEQGRKGKGQLKLPRKEIKKKITGSIPVLKKPVTSLIGRNIGKPKTLTTARVSVSTLVQQKPTKSAPSAAEEAVAEPTRDVRRSPAQRSRPPASESASWRNSAEVKRQSLVGSPPGTSAAPAPAAAAAAPARSRSAADLGSRISAATGRAGPVQQTGRAAAGGRGSTEVLWSQDKPRQK